MSWFEHFRTPEWRPYRAMMFVGLGVSGVIPVIHGLTIYGYQELNGRTGLNWVLLQGVLYILGAFIYAVSHHPPMAIGFLSAWPARSLTDFADEMAREKLPEDFRHLGQLSPDIPCIDPHGCRIAFVRHG